MENKKNSPVDDKILAMESIMSHKEWPKFIEVVQTMQGSELAKLMTKAFIKLSPEDKDKEHYAIVRVNETLNRLLSLPQWLKKRRPGYWTEVAKYLTEEAENG